MFAFNLPTNFTPKEDGGDENTQPEQLDSSPQSNTSSNDGTSINWRERFYQSRDELKLAEDSNSVERQRNLRVLGKYEEMLDGFERSANEWKVKLESLEKQLAQHCENEAKLIAKLNGFSKQTASEVDLNRRIQELEAKVEQLGHLPKCRPFDPVDQAILFAALADESQDEENSERIKQLIKNGTTRMSIVNEEGSTLLYVACENTALVDGEEIVELMLERGANVNAKCEGGKTPLMNCCDSRNYSILPVLLKWGADANETFFGATALWFACIQPDVSVSVVSQLAHRMDASINFGSQIVISGENGDFCKGSTPLHCAAKCNASFSVLQHLVEAGADLDSIDEEGRNPCDCLPRHDCDPKKRQLLKAAAL